MNSFVDIPFGCDSDDDLDQQEEAQETVARLRSLYEQGVPFFSKRTFQDLVRQLDYYRANPSAHALAGVHEDDSDPDSDSDLGKDWPVVSVPTIVDGLAVECRLKTGLVMAGDKKNTDFVLRSPHLRYRSFQHLCHDVLESYVTHEWAYSSTHLSYPMQRRRIRTGRLLDDPRKRQPPAVVKQAFEDGVRQWEESPACQRLRALFDSVFPRDIRNIVAFACGTMTSDYSYESSIPQHALTLTILDVLRRRDKAQPDIRCFAQDPAYIATDEEILGGAGITVLEDPRGFLEVDDNSVVLSFSPNVPVKQIIADIARPAVVIWDRVTGEAKDAERCTDPESPRVWAMIENHYDKVADLGPNEMFGDAEVYVRRG